MRLSNIDMALSLGCISTSTTAKDIGLVDDFLDDVSDRQLIFLLNDENYGNPTRDDHAIFPETLYQTMASQGYTVNSGEVYLGYVYPM